MERSRLRVVFRARRVGIGFHPAVHRLAVFVLVVDDRSDRWALNTGDQLRMGMERIDQRRAKR